MGIFSKLKKMAVAGLAALGLMAVSVGAHAALPAEATAAFTTLQGNATDIFAAIWPIVAFVTGGFVLISLFKKGANKVA